LSLGFRRRTCDLDLRGFAIASLSSYVPLHHAMIVDVASNSYNRVWLMPEPFRPRGHPPRRDLERSLRLGSRSPGGAGEQRSEGRGVAIGWPLPFDTPPGAVERSGLDCGFAGGGQAPRPVPSRPVLSRSSFVLGGGGGLTYLVPRAVKSRKSRSRDF
jgi:hypothetical protein